MRIAGQLLGKFTLALCLVFSSLLITGCGGKTVLYSNLKEKDANEMMALLETKGVPCTKIAGKENTWELNVASVQFAHAIELLEAEGYPPTAYQGLGQIFGQKGMVSSPTEERARFMYALSQSLAETIAQIDGVLTARVHVVLAETEPFSDRIRPASASVFIKCRYDMNLDAYIPQIKNLVANSIEGLVYDHVSVVIFRANPPEATIAQKALLWQKQAPPTYKSVMSIKVDPAYAGRLWTIIILLVLLFLAAAGMAGFALWQLLQQEHQAASPPPPQPSVGGQQPETEEEENEETMPPEQRQ